MAARFLLCLLRRDVAPDADLTKFFVENTISPHPTIRNYAQRYNVNFYFGEIAILIILRGITKILTFVKIRTYSKSVEELWLAEWANPMQHTLAIGDPKKFLSMLEKPLVGDGDDL